MSIIPEGSEPSCKSGPSEETAHSSNVIEREKVCFVGLRRIYE